MVDHHDREDEIARARRAAARASWPGRKTDASDQAGDEPLLELTPSERFGLVWQLTLDAWALSGRPIPDYSRHETPGVVVRSGARRVNG